MSCRLVLNHSFYQSIIIKLSLALVTLMKNPSLCPSLRSPEKKMAVSVGMYEPLHYIILYRDYAMKIGQHFLDITYILYH